MEITWLGHSCFRIKSTQALIITDPLPSDLGYAPLKQTPNIVTISHRHPSHADVTGIGGNPKYVTGPGEYEISGVLITGVATFHDTERGKARGKNTAYLMDIDGVAVCHLGDLGHVLTATQAEEFDNVDVLMIPVGGGATINAATAAEVVRQLEPKIILPMHYQTPAVSRELDPVDKFLKEMGLDAVAPQPKLSVTKSNLPLVTQVILLDY